MHIINFSVLFLSFSSTWFVEFANNINHIGTKDAISNKHFFSAHFDDISDDNSSKRPDLTVELESFSKGTYTFPKPTLENMISLFEMRQSQFDSELKKFDFDQEGYDENCKYFSSKEQPLNGYYTIVKCPSGYMTFEWSIFKSAGFLNEIIYGLESFYISSSNGIDTYGFKYSNEKSYKFTVMRTKDLEIVSISNY